MLRYRTKLSLV